LIYSNFYDESDIEKRLERISKADNLSKCLYAINKGNRLDYLNWLHKGQIITDQECADAVHNIWTMQENFYKCGMSKSNLIKFMKIAEKSPLLQSDIDDLSEDNTITIYRGVRVNNYRGLSWTTDKNVAEWFAKRFGNNGDKCFVFTGIITKKNIIDIFNCRNEKEIVCDYRRIKNIRCEEIIITDNEKSSLDSYIQNVTENR
jgi:hypothetical protein